MRGSHSLLGRLPECCSWTCPQQKRKETWGLDLAAERCPSPDARPALTRHGPGSGFPCMFHSPTKQFSEASENKDSAAGSRSE